MPTLKFTLSIDKLHHFVPLIALTGKTLPLDLVAATAVHKQKQRLILWLHSVSPQCHLDGIVTLIAEHLSHQIGG